MEVWVRRIAREYGIGYDTFLRKALGRTGPRARELEEITDAQLAELAIGTGVSIEQMRGMNIATVMKRQTENIQIWLLTEEGRDGLAQIRTTLRLMVSRGR